ncbi:MAG: YggS family pyridoxal phosphate-dependent enzyme [Actinobacteria bacterium]|nr:YggS family pyridoxal phosphate-dependent enzyme [Actinomycetota bacterium]MTA37900.1 YggS family pyridoxal phosphate-dependent enzyme [Actinomycetota bacterium]
MAAECAKWGRDVNDVTLVVVTKFHPVSVIEELLDAGARHFGESRHQDAAPKADALADRDLTWHFVGQIQSNKARAIARYATVIHSLDRDSVVDALVTSEHRVDGFIELNLTDDPGRGGVQTADDMLRLAERILAAGTIDLRGVMAVAPQDADPSEAFAGVATMSGILRQAYPNATDISAGMSADWQQAIEHGATHLRIGSSITGNRPTPR